MTKGWRQYIPSECLEKKDIILPGGHLIEKDNKNYG
jgi:hypothetical protein